MNRVWRQRAAAAAGCGLLALLPACGGAGFSDSGSAGGDTGEIRMLVNITPNLTKSFWNELVAPFEEQHPGVDVKIEAPSGVGVKDTLPQLLASGNEPDVVETLMVDETLAPQMLELTDEEWVSDTPLVQEAALDGRIYTVGVGMQAQSLVFYNKDAFAEAGITELPQTFDELTEAMAKLKDAGYLPLQTAGDYVTGLQLLQITDPTIGAADPDWYQSVESGSTTVGETMLPVLQRYADWIDRGYIDKDALGLDDVAAQTSFLEGRSAMYIMGSWFVRTADDADPGFEVGVFPAPVEDGQPYPGPQGVTMAMPYMVLNSSANRDLATELVEWLVTDENAVAKQLQQDGNFREGYTDGLSPLGKEVQHILDEAPSFVAQGEGYGENTLPPGFNSEWNESVQGLYVGETPQQVAEAVDAWVEQNK